MYNCNNLIQKLLSKSRRYLCLSIISALFSARMKINVVVCAILFLKCKIPPNIGAILGNFNEISGNKFDWNQFDALKIPIFAFNSQDWQIASQFPRHRLLPQ